MNLINKIKAILERVQASQASHQQQIKVLKQYYEKESLEDFFETISCILKIVFSKSTISNQNTHVERIIDFLAAFVADVTPDDSSTTESFSDSDDSPHPFLTMIIREALKYHNLTNECLRYNSCLFIKCILKHIGEKTLDNEVCDLIQEAMLDRTLDPKSSVRMQAVLGLKRLQDPFSIPECPVMKSYLSLIVDPNAQIRAEVVSCIAPKNVVIIQIVKRLRDVDPNVRTAAFRRCADFGPKQIKIIERQHILQCGLMETHPKVKNVFIENLLPKWIHDYNNNYIDFLKGLKLDADENDITNTENITRDVINLLLSTSPINDISSSIPITEEKIIEVDKLTSEAAALWNLLVSFLREKDNDDYIEEIIPNLTPFCNYIQRVVKERGKNVMEDWEFLDYQYILNNLFSMVEEYDLADEVGRRTLHQLTLELLRTENLQMKLKKKIVALAKKSSQQTEDFTIIICTIISDIREPVIEKTIQLNPADVLNKDYEIAKLKVDIISLEGDQEDALTIQDFLKADEFKTKIKVLREKLNELTSDKGATEMVRVIKDDPKTICDCLELLISLLQLPMITEITPSLMTVKDEFVLPLLNSNVSDINWRVLECISLFCTLDQHMAEEYIKVLSIPIITYRVIPNYNKHALLVSIKAISDLVRLFSVTVFDNIDYMENDANGLMNTTNRRRLYTVDDLENTITSKFRVEAVVEIILDMLDDELSDIRDSALEAISKLILDNFPVSSLLVSRLILKWYNPLTVKSSDKLDQLIGGVLGYYAHFRTGAKEVIAKAIIPTLHSIASAPATSPLVDVDVDNLLLFLATLTNSDNKMDSGTHLNMAHMFIYEITKAKESLMILYLSKILLHLDISTENVTVVKELIGQVDTTLENQILDKPAKKHIQKFKEKLHNILENQINKDTVISEKSIQLSSVVEEDESDNANNANNIINIDNNQLEKEITLPDQLENTPNGAKELPKKKKRRNRKTTKTLLESGSTGDEEEQQITKRLKVVINNIDDNTKKTETTKGMVEVGKGTKILQIRLNNFYQNEKETTKDMVKVQTQTNMLQIRLSGFDQTIREPEEIISSSNSDVINATPEDELIEKLNMSKRKRLLLKNKSDSEESSDSDSINRRKRKIREKSNNDIIEIVAAISTKNTIINKNLQRKKSDVNTNSGSTNSDVENNSVRNNLRSSKIVSEIQDKVDRKNGNHTKSDTTNKQQVVSKGSTVLKNKMNQQLRLQKESAKTKSMVTNSSTDSGNSKKVSSSESESTNDKIAPRRGRSQGSDTLIISQDSTSSSNRSLRLSQNKKRKPPKRNAKKL